MVGSNDGRRTLSTPGRVRACASDRVIAAWTVGSVMGNRSDRYTTNRVDWENPSSWCSTSAARACSLVAGEKPPPFRPAPARGSKGSVSSITTPQTIRIAQRQRYATLPRRANTNRSLSVLYRGLDRNGLTVVGEIDRPDRGVRPIGSGLFRDAYPQQRLRVPIDPEVDGEERPLDGVVGEGDYGVLRHIGPHVIGRPAGDLLVLEA